MSSNQPKKVIFETPNVTSLLDLKTEYLKRKNELSSRFNAGVKDVVNQTKNNIFRLSKEEKESKNNLKYVRQTRIRENEAVLKKEEEERLKRLKILEQKAAIYEKMSKGETLVYDDGTKPEFLVDFEIKKREIEREQELNNEASSLTKTNNSLDEKKTEENSLDVHYDHTEEKGRVFGASHVPLTAVNEDERLKRIKEIKNLTIETNAVRQKKKTAAAAKKAELKARLNRLRVRQGLPIVESSSSSENEEDASLNVQLDNIPLPFETDVDVTAAKKAKVLDEKPVKYGVREWDRGKVGYTKWISEQRKDRIEEFRPPSFYYNSK